MRSDLTARARIRDAALELFGSQGVNRVTVRVIAARAQVSPALVLHHFGSKEGLREECDNYLVSMLRGSGERVELSDTSGLGAMLEAAGPVRAYLARAFLDGSPQAAMLFDEMVEASQRWLESAAEEGWVRPAQDPRARAAMYVGWLLSPLVLRPHLSRVLGTEDLTEMQATMRYSRVAIEMLTHGVFADERLLATWDKLR